MAVKRWPDRRWSRLVHLLTAQGHPVLGASSNPFVPALPAGGLRHLAACFAAVGRRGGVVVGGDTGPLRIASAVGARTVGLFGPTLAARYGLGGMGAPGHGADLQGLPDCPHRRPTSITEQVCWWDAACPLSPAEPACLAAISAERAALAVGRLLGPTEAGG